MVVAVIIGLIALVSASIIVAFAVTKHQRDTGVSPTWSEIKGAFSSGAIKDVRQESAMLSEPASLASDVSVKDLFADAEEGSGYVVPRDLSSLRSTRN